jgi:hypothetical protein
VWLYGEYSSGKKMEQHWGRLRRMVWAYGLFIFLVLGTSPGLIAAFFLVRLFANGSLDYSMTLIVSGFVAGGIIISVIAV